MAFVPHVDFLDFVGDLFFLEHHPHLQQQQARPAQTAVVKHAIIEHFEQNDSSLLRY